MRSSCVIPALLLALAIAGAGCLADQTADAPAPGVGIDAALIAPEALASHLPAAVPGWRLLAPPSAVLLDEDGVPIVSATASYLADDGVRSADISLQDTAGRSAGLRRLLDQAAAAPPGGTVQATLGGYPAYMLEDGAMTGAYLVVDDRYAAWIAVTGGSRADLEAFVAAMDLDGLPARR